MSLQLACYLVVIISVIGVFWTATIGTKNGYVRSITLRSVLPPITRLANANDVILRVFVNHNTCFYSDVGIRLSVSLFQIYIMTSLVYTCCEGACNNVCGLKHLMQPRLTARQSLSHASITCHMF